MGISILLDVKALSKLFDELSNEQVLHIKQAVIEEVCRRKITAIVPKEVEAMVGELVKKELKAKVGSIKRDWLSDKYEISINTQFEMELKAFVNKYVQKCIDKFFEESPLAAETAKRIKETEERILGNLDHKISVVVANRIDHEMKKRIDTCVQERLDAVLGKGE